MNLTTSQLAAALKISRQRVNELGRLGKLHREKDGGWDPMKVNLALGANLDIHQVSPARGEATPPNRGGRPRKDAPPKAQPVLVRREQSRRETGPTPGTPAHAQFMKTQAQAAQEMMLAKKMEGSLIEVKAVRQMLCEFVSNAKTRLLAIGNKMAPALAIETSEAMIKAALDNEVMECLGDLARWEP